MLGKSSRSTTALRLVGQNAFASIEHRVAGRLVRIGSAAGNDLMLPHRSVSARHAAIRHTLGKYFVRDLGSTNGTFLNGHRLESEQELHSGDELRFGAARFATVAGAKPASSIFRYVGAALGAHLAGQAADILGSIS